MNGKGMIAVATVSCFLFTSVFAPGLQAAIEMRQANERFAQAVSSCFIPPSLGRVTGSREFASPTVVVNIQDLHCHPEVQRNIARMLSRLDEEYHLSAVYVEGAAGEVDTSWLLNISDGDLRRELSESMLAQGKLTGTEYYSLLSRRPRVLRGLENERLYRENLLRLDTLIERQKGYAEKLQVFRTDLERMKERYFNGRNLRFEDLLRRYRKGEVETGKYYLTTLKYAEKFVRDDGQSHAISAAGTGQFRNIREYLSMMEQARRLRYGAVSRELQEFMGELKTTLPYSAYNELLAKTGNFTRLDELYAYLPAVARACRLDIPARYPALEKFFEYLEKNQGIDPLRIVAEERKLTETVRAGLSEDLQEYEVAFLANFFSYFEDYLSNRLSAEDYAYFVNKYPAFASLWKKYSRLEDFAGLENEFELLNTYYRVNLERNTAFIGNIASTLGGFDGGLASGTAASPIPLLKGARNVIVVVAGGFHTQGIERLLAGRRISYLTITPNVTGDTKFSDETYAELARQQAQVLSQTLAPMLASVIVRLARSTGSGDEQVKARAAFLMNVLEAELRKTGDTTALIAKTRELIDSIECLRGTQAEILAATKDTPLRMLFRQPGGETLVMEERGGKLVLIGEERGTATPGGRTLDLVEALGSGAARLSGLEPLQVMLDKIVIPLNTLCCAIAETPAEEPGDILGHIAQRWRQVLAAGRGKVAETVAGNPVLSAAPWMLQFTRASGMREGVRYASLLGERYAAFAQWEALLFLPFVNLVLHKVLVRFNAAEEISRKDKVLSFASGVFLASSLFVPWLLAPSLALWIVHSAHFFSAIHKDTSVRQKEMLYAAGIVLAIVTYLPLILTPLSGATSLAAVIVSVSSALANGVMANAAVHSLINLFVYLVKRNASPEQGNSRWIDDLAAELTYASVAGRGKRPAAMSAADENKALKKMELLSGDEKEALCKRLLELNGEIIKAIGKAKKAGKVLEEEFYTITIREQRRFFALFMEEYAQVRGAMPKDDAFEHAFTYAASIYTDLFLEELMLNSIKKKAEKTARPKGLKPLYHDAYDKLQRALKSDIPSLFLCPLDTLEALDQALAFYQKEKGEDNVAVATVYGTPDTDRAQLIGSFMPKENGEKGYEFVGGVLYNLVSEAQKHPEKTYILRLEQVEALSAKVWVQLNQYLLTGELAIPEKPGEKLTLPANLKIVTSLAGGLRDSAFYDRFLRKQLNLPDDDALRKFIVQRFGCTKEEAELLVEWHNDVILLRGNSSLGQLFTLISYIVGQRADTEKRLRRRLMREESDEIRKSEQYLFFNNVYATGEASHQPEWSYDRKNDMVLIDGVELSIKAELRKKIVERMKQFKKGNARKAIEEVNEDQALALSEKTIQEFSVKVANGEKLHVRTITRDAIAEKLDQLSVGPAIKEIFNEELGLVLTNDMSRALSAIARSYRYGNRVLRLEGPTGTGKTFVAQSLAKMLDLPFYGEPFNAASRQSQLLGAWKPDEHGDYRLDTDTPFLRILENGGVIALSELNAAVKDDKARFGWLMIPLARGDRELQLNQYPRPQLPGQFGRTLKRSEQSMVIIDINPSETYAARGDLPGLLQAYSPSAWIEGRFEKEELQEIVEGFLKELPGEERGQVSPWIAQIHFEIQEELRKENRKLSPDEPHIISIRELKRACDSFVDGYKQLGAFAAFRGAVRSYYGLAFKTKNEQDFTETRALKIFLLANVTASESGKNPLSITNDEARQEFTRVRDIDYYLEKVLFTTVQPTLLSTPAQENPFARLKRAAAKHKGTVIERFNCNLFTDDYSLFGGYVPDPEKEKTANDGQRHFKLADGLLSRMIGEAQKEYDLAKKEKREPKVFILAFENYHYLRPQIAVALNAVLQDRVYYPRSGNTAVELPPNLRFFATATTGAEFKLSPAEQSRWVRMTSLDEKKQPERKPKVYASAAALGRSYTVGKREKGYPDPKDERELLIPTKEMLKIESTIVGAMNDHKISVLEGGPGGGKTDIAIDVAERFGLPLHVYSAHARSHLQDIIGSYTQDSRGRFILTSQRGEDGHFKVPFIELYTHGGVFIIDEGAIGVRSQALISWLTGIARGEDELVIHEHPGAEPLRLKRHKHFHIIITMNPVDETPGRENIPPEVLKSSVRISVPNTYADPSYTAILKRFHSSLARKAGISLEEKTEDDVIALQIAIHKRMQEFVRDEAAIEDPDRHLFTLRDLRSSIALFYSFMRGDSSAEAALRRAVELVYIRQFRKDIAQDVGEAIKDTAKDSPVAIFKDGEGTARIGESVELTETIITPKHIRKCAPRAEKIPISLARAADRKAMNSIEIEQVLRKNGDPKELLCTLTKKDDLASPSFSRTVAGPDGRMIVVDATGGVIHVWREGAGGNFTASEHPDVFGDSLLGMDVLVDGAGRLTIVLLIEDDKYVRILRETEPGVFNEQDLEAPSGHAGGIKAFQDDRGLLTIAAGIGFFGTSEVYIGVWKEEGGGSFARRVIEDKELGSKAFTIDAAMDPRGRITIAAGGYQRVITLAEKEKGEFVMQELDTAKEGDRLYGVRCLTRKNGKIAIAAIAGDPFNALAGGEPMLYEQVNGIRYVRRASGIQGTLSLDLKETGDGKLLLTTGDFGAGPEKNAYFLEEQEGNKYVKSALFLGENGLSYLKTLVKGSDVVVVAVPRATKSGFQVFKVPKARKAQQSVLVNKGKTVELAGTRITTEFARRSKAGPKEEGLWSREKREVKSVEIIQEKREQDDPKELSFRLRNKKLGSKDTRFTRTLTGPDGRMIIVDGMMEGIQIWREGKYRTFSASVIYNESSLEIIEGLDAFVDKQGKLTIVRVVNKAIRVLREVRQNEFEEEILVGPATSVKAFQNSDGRLTIIAGVDRDHDSRCRICVIKELRDGTHNYAVQYLGELTKEGTGELTVSGAMNSKGLLTIVAADEQRNLFTITEEINGDYVVRKISQFNEGWLDGLSCLQRKDGKIDIYANIRDTSETRNCPGPVLFRQTSETEYIRIVSGLGGNISSLEVAYDDAEEPMLIAGDSKDKGGDCSIYVLREEEGNRHRKITIPVGGFDDKVAALSACLSPDGDLIIAGDALVERNKRGYHALQIYKLPGMRQIPQSEAVWQEEAIVQGSRVASEEQVRQDMQAILDNNFHALLLLEPGSREREIIDGFAQKEGYDVFSLESTPEMTDLELIGGLFPILKGEKAEPGREFKVKEGFLRRHLAAQGATGTVEGKRLLVIHNIDALPERVRAQLNNFLIKGYLELADDSGTVRKYFLPSGVKIVATLSAASQREFSSAFFNRFIKLDVSPMTTQEGFSELVQFLMFEHRLTQYEALRVQQIYEIIRTFKESGEFWPSGSEYEFSVKEALLHGQFIAFAKEEALERGVELDEGAIDRCIAAEALRVYGGRLIEQENDYRNFVDLTLKSLFKHEWVKELSDEVLVQGGAVRSISGVRLPYAREGVQLEEIDPRYRLTLVPKIVRTISGILRGWQAGKIVSMVGETGAAKTTMGVFLSQLMFGSPDNYYIYSTHGESKARDLGVQLKMDADRKFSLEEQEFLMRLKKGNQVLIVDEANMRPELLWALNGLARGEKQITIEVPGEEAYTVTAGENIFILFTMNPESYSERGELPNVTLENILKLWAPAEYPQAELEKILKDLAGIAEKKAARQAHERAAMLKNAQKRLHNAAAKISVEDFIAAIETKGHAAVMAELPQNDLSELEQEILAQSDVRGKMDNIIFAVRQSVPGVRLVFTLNGWWSMTMDGKVITVPLYELVNPKRSTEAVIGLIIHEMRHKRYSPTQEELREIVKEPGLTKIIEDPLFHGLWNAIEDLRIDLMDNRFLSGENDYIKAMNDGLFNQPMSAKTRQSLLSGALSVPHQVFTSALMHYWYAKHYGDYRSEHLEVFGQLPKKITDAVNEVIREGKGQRSLLFKATKDPSVLPDFEAVQYGNKDAKDERVRAIRNQLQVLCTGIFPIYQKLAASAPQQQGQGQQGQGTGQGQQGKPGKGQGQGKPGKGRGQSAGQKPGQGQSQGAGQGKPGKGKGQQHGMPGQAGAGQAGAQGQTNNGKPVFVDMTPEQFQQLQEMLNSMPQESGQGSASSGGIVITVNGKPVPLSSLPTDPNGKEGQPAPQAPGQESKPQGTPKPSKPQEPFTPQFMDPSTLDEHQQALENAVEEGKGKRRHEMRKNEPLNCRLAEVSEYGKRLAKGLVQLFRVPDEPDVEESATGWRINPVRYITRHPEPFDEEVEMPGKPDLAISVTIDCSGSMRGYRPAILRMLAIFISTFCIIGKKKCDYGVSVVTSVYNELKGFRERILQERMNARHGEIEKTIEEEGVEDTGNGIGIYNAVCGIIESFKDTSKKNKIALICTDGEDVGRDLGGFEDGKRQPSERLKQKLDEARRLGIEIVGVGFKATPDVTVFDKWVQLQPDQSEMVVEVLLKIAKQKAGRGTLPKGDLMKELGISVNRAALNRIAGKQILSAGTLQRMAFNGAVGKLIVGPVTNVLRTGSEVVQGSLSGLQKLSIGAVFSGKEAGRAALLSATEAMKPLGHVGAIVRRELPAQPHFPLSKKNGTIYFVAEGPLTVLAQAAELEQAGGRAVIFSLGIQGRTRNFNGYRISYSRNRGVDIVSFESREALQSALSGIAAGDRYIHGALRKLLGRGLQPVPLAIALDKGSRALLSRDRLDTGILIAEGKSTELSWSEAQRFDRVVDDLGTLDGAAFTGIFEESSRTKAGEGVVKAQEVTVSFAWKIVQEHCGMFCRALKGKRIGNLRLRGISDDAPSAMVRPLVARLRFEGLKVFGDYAAAKDARLDDALMEKISGRLVEHNPEKETDRFEGMEIDLSALGDVSASGLADWLGKLSEKRPGAVITVKLPAAIAPGSLAGKLPAGTSIVEEAGKSRGGDDRCLQVNVTESFELVTLLDSLESKQGAMVEINFSEGTLFNAEAFAAKMQGLIGAISETADVLYRMASQPSAAPEPGLSEKILALLYGHGIRVREKGFAAAFAGRSPAEIESLFEDAVALLGNEGALGARVREIAGIPHDPMTAGRLLALLQGTGENGLVRDFLEKSGKKGFDQLEDRMLFGAVLWQWQWMITALREDIGRRGVEAATEEYRSDPEKLARLIEVLETADEKELIAGIRAAANMTGRVTAPYISENPAMTTILRYAAGEEIPGIEKLLKDISFPSLRHPQEVLAYARAYARYGNFSYQETRDVIDVAYARLKTAADLNGPLSLVELFCILELLNDQQVKFENAEKSRRIMDMRSMMSMLGAA